MRDILDAEKKYKEEKLEKEAKKISKLMHYPRDQKRFKPKSWSGKKMVRRMPVAILDENGEIVDWKW